MRPSQKFERRFIPDWRRRSVVIFRDATIWDCSFNQAPNSSSSKRLEGRLELAPLKSPPENVPNKQSSRSWWNPIRIRAHSTSRILVRRGAPDPMMVQYLIPPSPRYSESYVRVRRAHATEDERMVGSSWLASSSDRRIIR
jgi:hypothetical protein